MTEQLSVTVDAPDPLSTSLLALCLARAHVVVVDEQGHRADDARGRVRVAVVDADHPSSDVVELASTLRRRHDAVVLLGHAFAPGLVRRAVQAGVSGVVSKDHDADELVRVVRLVAAGRDYVDPALAAAALRCADDPLTPREREVLSRVDRESTVVEIAGELHLAPGTVRNLVSSAVRKTGASSSTRAAARARAQGWI